jgi:hypothetical protein
VTITLGNTTASDAPATPTLSPAERWVVGQINDMRQAKNPSLPRLRVSTTLNRVAYATAHDAVALKAAHGSYPWPPAYCAAVGADWGWPQLSLDTHIFGGNDAATTSPSAALAHWTDSSARGQLTFNSGVSAIGIADGGGAWTMFVSDCSSVPADVAARCELTNDTGDSSIQLPPSGSGSGSGSGTGTGTGTGTGGATGSPPGPFTVNSLASSLASAFARMSSAALLKSGGAKIRFSAAGAGRAGATCATTAHRHRLKLMNGSDKLLRAQSVTLRLRLTAAGRKLLAQLHQHHRSLHANCAATFVPTQGKKVTKTMPVTLAP